MVNKRIQSIALILTLALAAIAALLLLMNHLAASKAASAFAPDNDIRPDQAQTTAQIPQSTITSAEAEEIVATVNEEIITRQMWQQATRLDAAMSRLANQPAPTAEETLDRLVNEIIVLNGVGNMPVPAEADIEARISALAAAWNVTETALVTTLQEAGLARTDLTGRVQRLLQVEAALNQLAGREQDLDAWLAQARANAEIGLYRSLVEAVKQPQPGESAAPAETSSQTDEPAETILASAQTFAPPADMPISPYPQNAAPDFTLPQLNGESLTLSQLRGQPAIINFWATWCPPCRSELPALQAAYVAHKGQIGFVAVDVKEEANTVAGFAQELGLNFPIVVDADGAVSDGSYQIRGLPTTLFIDANGVVVARHVGPLNEESIESYLSPLLESWPEDTAPPANPTEPADQNSAAAGIGPDAGISDVESAPQDAAQLTTAPNFTLNAANGDPISLQDYKDKSSVVLVFYRGHT
jgi:peroxiredoxin